MAEGHNRRFLVDPSGYSRNKIILTPEPFRTFFWNIPHRGPFDLTPVQRSGFPGTVLILNQLNRRTKARTDRTRPIPGVWIPYIHDDLTEADVNATSAPFFVFTNRLGGCALGIRDLNKPNTVFFHDATADYKTNLAQAGLTLFPNEYDPKDEGKNITAFFWWNGIKWQLGKSAIYSAHFQCQVFAANVYDRYPMNAFL